MNPSKLINATRQYNSLTANGAVTHSTSLSAVLDMFFLAGASRSMSEENILTVFTRAFAENKQLACKVLFWARDARGGAGEKRFFQVIMRYLTKQYSDIASELLIHVPEFGYWKDIFSIEEPNEDNLNWLSIQLEENPNANLLAKWFPRKGKWFSAMHKYLKMSPKEFRKKLVKMTSVVETQMCSKKWNDIDYAKVPSIAMNKYRNAFIRQDNVRYTEFIEAVMEGKAKINASVLFPHQLYQAILKGQDEKAVEAQWQNLPNYMEGSTERILPVCDVSGSMTGLPMDVSVSLGLYIAERNEGIFRNAFMTFSEEPEMVYVQGDTLGERLAQVNSAEWGYTTNLQATFDLILSSALREGISEEEMPTKLLIISDMEFDAADEGKTNLDVIRKKYREAGYKMPEIIFWNVNGRIGNSPAHRHDQNIGLVSGFSPSILKAILKGEVASPESLMLEAILDKRYDCIRVTE